MGSQNYFLITSLPVLGRPGGVPPMPLQSLLEHVADTGGADTLVRAVLLADDLLQREAVLSGELDKPDPAVLTAAEAQGEEALPEYLAHPPTREHAPRVATDAVWEAYYRFAADTAGRAGSAFLAAWVRFEVGLRNALAEARAKALSLEPSGYLVATDLGNQVDDYARAVSEWSAAPDPLAGARALDAARWAWLEQNDSRYTFSDDELAVYAARLVLLHRWHRVSVEQESRTERQRTER